MGKYLNALSFCFVHIEMCYDVNASLNAAIVVQQVDMFSNTHCNVCMI